MAKKACCRHFCFVSGALFLLAPLAQMLGLIQIVFPDGEWASLAPVATLFGGSQTIVSEGNSYSFVFELNPFYIVLLSLSFIASLASLFGLDCRRNLIFSLIAGFFALLFSAFSLLSFHWVNPGFALDGIRGGTGFVLCICTFIIAIAFLIPSLVTTKGKRK